MKGALSGWEMGRRSFSLRCVSSVALLSLRNLFRESLNARNRSFAPIEVFSSWRCVMYAINSMWHTLIADSQKSCLKETEGSGNQGGRAGSRLFPPAIPSFCSEPAGCLVLGELWQTTQRENTPSEKVVKSQRPPILYCLSRIGNIFLSLFLFILVRRKDKRT